MKKLFDVITESAMIESLSVLRNLITSLSQRGLHCIVKCADETLQSFCVVYYFSWMPVKVKHTSKQSLFYITFTCFNWLPLFQLTNSYDAIYKWYAYLKEKKNVKVTAYVIFVAAGSSLHS